MAIDNLNKQEKNVDYYDVEPHTAETASAFRAVKQRVESGFGGSAQTSEREGQTGDYEQRLLKLLERSPQDDSEFESVTVRQALDIGGKKIETSLRGYESTQQGAKADLNTLLEINNFRNNDHQFGEVYIETESGSVYRLQSRPIDSINSQSNEHWRMTGNKDQNNTLSLLKTGTVEVGKRFDADFRAPDGLRHISTSPVKRITVLSTAMIGSTGNRDTDIVQRFDQASIPPPRK